MSATDIAYDDLTSYAVSGTDGGYCTTSGTGQSATLTRRIMLPSCVILRAVWYWHSDVYSYGLRGTDVAYCYQLYWAIRDGKFTIA
eukprot:1409005-Rhodomonas_salina.1